MGNRSCPLFIIERRTLHMLSAQKKDTWKLIILFFMPAVIIWLTTMIIPFLYGIWISFVKWDGIGNNFTFVGSSEPEIMDCFVQIFQPL